MITRGTGFIIESSSNRFLIGSKCVVSRMDKSTGFFWVLSMTLVKQDPAYRTIEFGPYCAADIPAGKIRRAKVHVPAGLLAEIEDVRGKFVRKSTA